MFATQAQVDNAIRNNLRQRERVHKVVDMCAERGRIKITPQLTLALGLRETWLRNILGGAQLVDGRWVPETDPTLMDAGFLQISKKWHADELKQMEAVRSGTWQPVIDGANAFQAGMVPTFRIAVPFVLDELAASLDYAREHGVPDAERQRFAVAAHNAGKGGALDGWRRGDVDRFTASGDYSAWVLDAAGKVKVFLDAHPSWMAE